MNWNKISEIEPPMDRTVLFCSPSAQQGSPYMFFGFWGGKEVGAMAPVAMVWLGAARYWAEKPEPPEGV